MSATALQRDEGRTRARRLLRRCSHGQRERQVLEAGDILAQCVRQAHHDVEPPVALEYQARLAPPIAVADHVQHVGDVQPVAGDRRLVRCLTSSSGSPVVCSTLTSAPPRTPRSTLAISLAVSVHRVEVVAVDLDRDVAAHAGDQLVEAHLDRLREFVVVAGQRFDCRSILRYQPASLVSVRVGPLLPAA